MKQWTMAVVASVAALAVTLGCGDDDDTGSSAAGAAGQSSAGSGGSATAGSGGSATAGSGGSAIAGAGGATSEFGFDIRYPQTHTIDCTGEGPAAGPQDLTDADVLCTFEDAGVSAIIYVQATPVSCMAVMSAIPTYEVQLAQISIDGVVETLQNVTYDYGGNHMNDTLEFDYGGKTYWYDHSSLGFGGRACHPMDCVRITEGSVTDDGCTCDRTHPVVCAPIEADGSHADLGEDTFEVCLGDETCG